MKKTEQNSPLSLLAESRKTKRKQMEAAIMEISADVEGGRNRYGGGSLFQQKHKNVVLFLVPCRWALHCK
jgi:hypothetical protein